MKGACTESRRGVAGACVWIQGEASDYAAGRQPQRNLSHRKVKPARVPFGAGKGLAGVDGFHWT